MSGSVQMPKIARYFTGSAQPESVCTRIRRFLEDESFDPIDVARKIATSLGLSRISRWTLVIDRTNWQYGDTYNNLLVLGVIYKKSFVPLLFENLGDKRKSGNSSTQDRSDIMDLFCRAFPDQRIKFLTADREFIGSQWVEYLDQKEIPYILRIRENWDVIFDEANKRTLPIKEYVKSRMSKNRVQCIEDVPLGFKGKMRASLTIFPVKTREGDRDIGMVMHSPNIKNAHLQYRKRWTIEVAFKHIKTGGLNLEDSHITNRSRFETLIHVMFMTVAWILTSERQLKNLKPNKNSTNGLSVFRTGLEKLIRFIMPPKIHPSNAPT